MVQSGRLYLRRVTFDEAGRPLEERFTNGNDTPGSRVEYIYGEDGRLLLKLFHHPDAPVPDREEYLWEGDRLFSVARIFTTGKYGWRYEYHYDDSGRLKRAVKIDRYWKDVVVWTKKFRFDSEGRVAEVSGGGLDENIQWREEYNYPPGESALAEKKRWDAQDRMNSHILYRYDREGSLVSEKDLSPSG